MFSLNLKPNNKETKKTPVSNPKILEVNLIKEESGASFNWGKNLLFALLVFLVAALLVVEIYFGLDWWSNQEVIKTQTTETEIAKLSQDISVLNNQADAALRYKDKVVVLSGLLDNHIYWSNFLNWLEKNTLSTVQYQGLEGDTSGVYAFGATAKTYADVSWQVKAFLNDPLTKKVSVLDASSPKNKDKTAGSEVDFTINLEVNPTIFNK
jgi:hypothetical protein